jgi:hypothetical protein
MIYEQHSLHFAACLPNSGGAGSNPLLYLYQSTEHHIAKHHNIHNHRSVNFVSVVSYLEKT